MNDSWFTECEAFVHAAAPALHDKDVELIAHDLRRLFPALTPGAAVDRYFGPGELPDGRRIDAPVGIAPAHDIR